MRTLAPAAHRRLIGGSTRAGRRRRDGPSARRDVPSARRVRRRAAPSSRPEPQQLLRTLQQIRPAAECPALGGTRSCSGSGGQLRGQGTAPARGLRLLHVAQRRPAPRRPRATARRARLGRCSWAPSAARRATPAGAASAAGNGSPGSGSGTAPARGLRLLHAAQHRPAPRRPRATARAGAGPRLGCGLRLLHAAQRRPAPRRPRATARRARALHPLVGSVCCTPRNADRRRRPRATARDERRRRTASPGVAAPRRAPGRDPSRRTRDDARARCGPSPAAGGGPDHS